MLINDIFNLLGCANSMNDLYMGICTGNILRSFSFILGPFAGLNPVLTSVEPWSD